MPIQEIPAVEIIDATLNYNVGDAPKATAQVTGDAAAHCAIEYECWEEIDENGDPLAFWYSDESQYQSSQTKITAFEAGKTYTYSLMVKAVEGYVFGTNATLKINDIVVNAPSIMNPPLPPEACIIGDRLKTVTMYQVIDGANSTWTQGTDGTLTIRAMCTAEEKEEDNPESRKKPPCGLKKRGRRQKREARPPFR